MDPITSSGRTKDTSLISKDADLREMQGDACIFVHGILTSLGLAAFLPWRKTAHACVRESRSLVRDSLLITPIFCATERMTPMVILDAHSLNC